MYKHIQKASATNITLIPISLTRSNKHFLVVFSLDFQILKVVILFIRQPQCHPSQWQYTGAENRSDDIFATLLSQQDSPSQIRMHPSATLRLQPPYSRKLWNVKRNGLEWGDFSTNKNPWTSLNKSVSREPRSQSEVKITSYPTWRVWSFDALSLRKKILCKVLQVNLEKNRFVDHFFQ